MKPILFLTGYGPQAPVILKYAQHLATQFETKLVAVHVFEGATATLMTGAIDKELSDSIEEMGNRQDKEEVEKLRSFIRENSIPDGSAVETSLILLSGDVILEVNDLLASKNYGLVVMGTQTRNNFQDFILGSVANETITTAKCPVVFVPPDAVFLPIQNILFSTNFSAEDQEIVNQLLDWTNAFQTLLHIIHVSENPDSLENSEYQMGQWKKYYTDYLDEDVIRYQVKSGKVAPLVLKYALENECGLIVLHPRKRSFFDRLLTKSDTEEIQKQALSPIMIYKSNI
jgi:nucleotide-binding universal stress UspA family protein